MMMTPRLAAYLYAIMKKVKNGEYVEALMKCPECDKEFATWDDATDDAHIVIKQKIGDTEFYYCIVGCEGYWIVDPKSLGFPRGNWSPTWEIIKNRIHKYAGEKKGLDLTNKALEYADLEDIAETIESDPELADDDKELLLRGLDQEMVTED